MSSSWLLSKVKLSVKTAGPFGKRALPFHIPTPFSVLSAGVLLLTSAAFPDCSGALTLML